MKKLLLTTAFAITLIGFNAHASGESSTATAVANAPTSITADAKKAEWAANKAEIKAFKEKYKAAASDSDKATILQDFKKEHPKAAAKFEEFENIQKLPAEEREAKMKEFKEKRAREREEREKNFSNKSDNASPEKKAHICEKIKARCADGKKNACKRSEEKCKDIATPSSAPIDKK